jgi:lipoate-protein ligase A
VARGFFINQGAQSATENMNGDLWMLKACAATGCLVARVYAWNPPAVSLGYFQKKEDINIDFCCREGIPIVKRVTGGGAIFHQHEITFSLALPLKYPGLPEVIEESYFYLLEPLRKTLLFFGVESFFRGINLQDKTEVNCFAKAATTDLMFGSEKIFGAAQRRMDKVVFMHGSLLLETEPRLWESIFYCGNVEKFKGVGSFLKGVSAEELSRLWKHQLEKLFSLSFEPLPLNWLAGFIKTQQSGLFSLNME